ncbi:cytochrome P450 [Lentinula aciculospora]|uniref:Cytochrome P450 n=1 Tax=Lentinula aciculospora TaxID=153920 RepID=A0A9W9DQV2_9AGAR|nr:cytochrome P450 [Lentinula aciculospora]
MFTHSLSSVSQAFALCGIFLATLLIPKILQWRARMIKLNAIPTVGSSGFFSSHLSARKFKTHAREIVQEGYKRYPGQAFKVPLPDRWEIIVSGKKMMEDIKKASDLELSLIGAVAEIMQSEYTLGQPATIDAYHIEVVRTSLTRNLGAKFADLQDEIKAAFADEIHAKETEWMQVPMLYTMMKIVSRSSSRYFVGLPLCRDPDYIKLNIDFTVDAFKGSQILQCYPAILKPLVRQFLTDVPACFKRATKHLEPIIMERLQKEKEYGSSTWPDKPNDLISWLLDEAQGERRKNIVYNIVSRVLVINFAAIHTTSMSLTNTLFHLAVNLHLAQPLREEVESTVAELGWTKAAMGKMWKLDSFLKETQRLTGSSVLSMSRLALKDFTFSNGTVIPAGTIVNVVAHGLHHDNAHYEDPETLNAFRFFDMRGEDENIKHQMVGIDPSFALFGGGRHMCPGRFFAVNELKALVAHVLVTYDIKFENDGKYPEPDWIGANCCPNRSAMVMFRKRSASPPS